MSCKNILSRGLCVVGNSRRGISARATSLTNAEVRKKRNEMFTAEKARQTALITRIEKVKVEHKGIPEDCSLLMNKSLSTPFNCAMHISELIVQRSVLALVNGQPWDMHRPLEEDCELTFVHFKDNDPYIANQTFWRSCSFILGYVLESAFKDNFNVQLCSFPKPNVKSGSFVYDADLQLPDWDPSTAELNCLSRIGTKLQHQDLPFERLDVDASLALRMFEDNVFKTVQIPHIAASSRSNSLVTLYRMGEHIDITRGPLMASTKLLQRFTVTAVHNIESPDFGKMKRIQGLASPYSLPVHFWTYEKLSQRASKMNQAPVPVLDSNPPAPNVVDIPPAPNVVDIHQS